MDNTPHANNFISDIPDRPPLVILTGPTAVGKTALSVNLAKKSAAKSSPLIQCKCTAEWTSALQK